LGKSVQIPIDSSVHKMLLDMGTNAYNEAIFLGLKLTLLNPSVLLSQSMFLSRHRAQGGQFYGTAL